MDVRRVLDGTIESIFVRPDQQQVQIREDGAKPSKSLHEIRHALFSRQSTDEQQAEGAFVQPEP